MFNTLQFIDKRIIKALKKSEYLQNYTGYEDEINDRDFLLLVMKFADKAWKKRKVRSTLEQCNLNKEDIIKIYLWITVDNMPNPVMKVAPLKHAYSMIASTIFGEVKKQLIPLIIIYEEKLRSGDSEPLKEASKSFAYILKRQHDLNYGRISLDETPV